MGKDRWAKIGQSDKLESIRQLSALARRAEKYFIPSGDLEAVIEKERQDSWKHGGRTIRQLRLF